MQAFEGANYLVRLLFPTKYSCGNTKIQKLLVIAQLYSYITKKAPLFDDKIVVRACGFGVEDINLLSTISGDEENDDNQPISPESTVFDTSNSEEIAPSYWISSNISAEEENILKTIIYRFGAYKAKTLGDLMSCWSLHQKDRIEGADIVNWLTDGMPLINSNDDDQIIVFLKNAGNIT